MSKVPEDRQYTAEHEWARTDGGHVVVGITDYAQDQLGDVVFVNLPDVGAEVTAGEPLGEVESTKSVSDIYSPVSGKVVERNENLDQTPELVNEDPYGSGWLVKVQSSGDGESRLIEAEAYRRLLEET